MNAEEKKTDEQLDNKSEEKKQSRSADGVKAIADITKALKVVDEKIDEALQNADTPCIAILELLITSFYENFQEKTMIVLKRDPEFRRISDKIDAERAQKKDE